MVTGYGSWNMYITELPESKRAEISAEKEKKGRGEHTFKHVVIKLLEVAIMPAHCSLAQSTVCTVLKKIRHCASY